MALGDTQQSILTLALNHLGAPPMSSITNPATPLETQILNYYQPVLNAELRKNDWLFAIKRLEYPDATSAQTDFETPNTWPLPTDCVRVLREQRDRLANSFVSEATDWWIEGRNICKKSIKGPKLRYISDAVDPSEYDPLFVMALSYRLAIAVCEYATQSTQKENALAQLYTGIISDASKQNSWEDPAGTTEVNKYDYSWISNRLILYNF